MHTLPSALKEHQVLFRDKQGQAKRFVCFSRSLKNLYEAFAALYPGIIPLYLGLVPVVETPVEKDAK